PPPAPPVCWGAIGNCTGRPSISRESVRRTSPWSTTQTSHDVPPMSSPIASGLPAGPPSSAAATAPRAGPESTLQAPARAASAASAVPPDERITTGSGSPRSRQAPDRLGRERARGGGRGGAEKGGGER